jgi:hypothetical protein
LYCNTCGIPNADTATTCTRCGATLARPTAPPPPGYAPPPYPPQGFSPAGAASIPNHLVAAILTTLFCCMPFGIVSIVYAAQVNTKIAAGDYAGAMQASQSAKTWSWVSFGLGLAFGILYVIGSVVAAAAG